MAEYLIQDTTLTAIADAIRNKTGQPGPLNPLDFSTAINSITTDGSGSIDDLRYVTFKNGDTLLYRKAVATGDDCVDVISRGLISTPTKESDVQYHYTYYGWGAEDNGAADDTILDSVTENKTVYAIYTSTLRSYTATYLDNDGATVLYTETLPYGTIPNYTPSKLGYTFAGWTTDCVEITEDVNYIATWTIAQIVTSGSCGDAATWTLDESGLFHVQGTGPMADYASGSESPWYADYATQILGVVIDDGITRVGSRSFNYCTNLIDVNMPDSVTSIGDFAFYSCSKLPELIIPEGVTSIGCYAFYDWSSLTTLVIPNAVTFIGWYAFANCTKLSSVTIGENVATIEYRAFQGCSLLQTISIPSSVTTIGDNTFLSTGLQTAYFAQTSGWKLYASRTATSYTTVNASYLANINTAAACLKSSYVAKWWKRS